MSDMKSMQLAVTDDIINLHELIGGDNEIRFVEATLPRIPQVFGDTGSNFESRPAVEMEFTPKEMEVRLHFYEQPHHALDVDEPLMLVVNLKRYLAWHAEW